MLKKTIRRLGALAMVLAMAVSVFAVNASAEGEQTPEAKKFYIKKTVSVTGQNVLAPNTTFSYAIANGTVAEGATGGNVTMPGTIGTVYVKNGVNANKIHIADSRFTPGDTASNKYEAQNEVTFDAGTFTAPGIYYYTVTETIPEDAAKYDGITYDDSTLKMYVYVVNDESGYKVDGVVVTKSGTTKGEGFDNKYEVDKNNDGQLVLTKEVTGTQGNKGADWTFKIEITGPEGEKYLTSNGTVIEANVQTATEVTLKHGQTFTIYGLSAGDKVKIVEDKANTEGYDTSYATKGKNDTDYGTATKYDNSKGIIVDGSAFVKVINDKNYTTPTGIIMTIAPYALMVVLAGAFAVVFLTRRNRAE